jgi:hypothetical protein
MAHCRQLLYFSLGEYASRSKPLVRSLSSVIDVAYLSSVSALMDQFHIRLEEVDAGTGQVIGTVESLKRRPRIVTLIANAPSDHEPVPSLRSRASLLLNMATVILFQGRERVNVIPSSRQ